MRNPPKQLCSIIIPVFNGLEYTRRCLGALAESVRKIPHEIIVVDNGSTDGTVEWLRNQPIPLRIISNNSNLGFARANNQGAKIAHGTFLVFLNNDTLPHGDWLNALIHRAQIDPDISAVGAKLLYPDGTVQHAGITFNAQGLPEHFLRGMPYADHPFLNKAREFQAVTAACVLIPRKIFFDAGEFNTDYRNGFEDVDLCLRIGSIGGKIYYEPKSVLIHFESKTEGRHNHEESNRRLYQRLWSGRVSRDEDSFGRAFLKDVLGFPARFTIIVPLREPSSSFVSCLTALRAAAVESPAQYSFIIADQILPKSSQCLEDLSRTVGLPLEHERFSSGTPLSTILLQVSRKYAADFTAIIDPRVLVGPGWAHRLARPLNTAVPRAAGPILSGGGGSQEAPPSLAAPSQKLLLSDVANAAYRNSANKSRAAKTLSPLAFMVNPAALHTLTHAPSWEDPSTAFRVLGVQLRVAEDAYAFFKENASVSQVSVLQSG
ncbi:MAG: hypothetical protein COB53_09225 [Elusimicrobia bacterium]|nr:MAG: hypothetical protein COB53_09225 [Elusimicrobiota bacterium]